MKTSKRLKQLMSERHLKQVDILNASKPFQKSLEINMSKSTLSQYVSGKQSPDQKHLFLLAKTLDVSEPWLMGYDVSMQRKNSNSNDNNVIKLTDIYTQLNEQRQHRVVNYASNQLREQESSSVKENTHVVYLSGYVSAGFGEYMVDDGSKPEPIEVTGSVPNYDIAVKVNGDSMEPTFANGQILYVKKITDPSLLRNGQFVIARIGDDAYVKKFHKQDKEIKLVSLNPLYKDITIQPEDDFAVIGTVII